MPWDGHWADISLIEKGTQKGKYKIWKLRNAKIREIVKLKIQKKRNSKMHKIENREIQKCKVEIYRNMYIYVEISAFENPKTILIILKTA